MLLFSLGLHSDYHLPSDAWEKIDIAGTTQILDVIQGVISKLMLLERPPNTRKWRVRLSYLSQAGVSERVLDLYRTCLGKWKASALPIPSPILHPTKRA